MSILMLLLLMLVPHELGHVLAVYAVGAKVKRVGIDRRGPYVLRSPAATPLRNALVSLAGPAANILTSIVLLENHSTHAWFPLCFGLFNLLPFPHSDGIHALSAFQLTK